VLEGLFHYFLIIILLTISPFSILTPSLIPLVILLILYLYLSFLSIIFLPFSLHPLYPSLYIPSFLPSFPPGKSSMCMYMVEDILVKCGRKRVLTMTIVITKTSMDMK
jgi:hypothetical protein